MATPQPGVLRLGEQDQDQEEALRSAESEALSGQRSAAQRPDVGGKPLINELSHVQIPVMLMPDDFKAYSKIKVDNHLFNKENMPSHFKFKEYCPMVFRNLRERFGIDDQDFQNSLTRSAPLPNDSQARSGARFHTSYDKRYIIKTITSEDVAEMHNILKKYHQYIVECHGITLLPQFLGMYRLNVDGVEIYVIVTRNVFSHRLSVYRKYDLKGSTVAREASDKEKAKELPTLKDNDFINEGQKIYIDDNNKKVFLEKLKKDVEFLAQLKLMDYSLLVGIHDVERAEQEEVECEENDGEEEGESDGTHPVGTPPDSPGNTLNSSPPLAPGEFDPNIDVYGIKCHESGCRDLNREPRTVFKALFGLYWPHLDVTSHMALDGHEHGKDRGGFGVGEMETKLSEAHLLVYIFRPR
ncbi:phosphatidylinositol 5-phosphate 4-kinase type-2 alpha isoform X1 [Ursus maritimus]|uniref:Phosphatidylinositol 5-phosphate 4-kinase type-2 alpha n=2 Tax=Ursus maritimus TaxID=29073 RepID=A0A8M1H554_URSMA|nr:phosphatidylinositol 5-phosphate 4-kinase type-2 alpha isoform X1 [Ursus maritimus]